MNVVPPTRAIPGARSPRHTRATVARLARAFAPFRRDVATAVSLVLVQTGLGLLGPYLMAIAIDRHVAASDVPGLERLAALMLAVALAASALGARSGWLMARASQRSVSGLRRALFAHLQALPVSFFSTHTPGQLASRLSGDMDAVAKAAAESVTALFAGALSMVAILATMVALDWRLAFASLLVIPLMIGFTGTIARRTRHGFRALQASAGNLAGVIEESIGGHAVVRAFGGEASVMETFRVANDAARDTGVRANTWALVLMPLTTVLGNLLVVVLAVLGGWLALEDKTTVGVVAAFITYAIAFVQPLRQMSNLYNTLQAALAGAERVFEVLDRPGERETQDGSLSAPPRGHVRFEHVVFRHREDGPRVIRDVTFDAASGRTTAIVGPTAAGKTTIVSLLERLHEVESGAILVDGVDVREIRRADLRRRIALVPQETWLFSGTVRENIRYGRAGASDEEVARAAEIACADGFIRQLPEGYDTRLDGSAAGLSRGQRQLLAIARAVLADPAILVLDEATSGVDTRTEARVQAALARLRAGRTTLVVAHRLSTVREADRVVVIDRGAVVEMGTHAELLATGGPYSELFGAQRERR